MDSHTRSAYDENVTVPVYILSEDARANRTKLTRAMFVHPLFSATVTTMDAPDDLDTSAMPKKNAIENYHLNKILEHSIESGDRDIIVIKDTSVTNSTPDGIADIVRTLLDDEERSDITFLSSWIDNCDELKNKRYIANKTSVIAQAPHPSGVQALLLSPAGRSMLLGKDELIDGNIFDKTKAIESELPATIARGALTADVIVPNLFETDALNTRKVQCKVAVTTETIESIIPKDIPIEKAETVARQMGTYGVSPIVIIFIAIIILIIIWIIYYYYK